MLMWNTVRRLWATPTLIGLLVFAPSTACAQQLEYLVGLGGSGFDNAEAISVDVDGNAYVTGSFQGEVDFGVVTLTSEGQNDIFVAKLDPTGEVIWATRAGGAGNDGGSGIQGRPNGQVYLTGSFADEATFGETVLNGVGGDVFFAKLDAAGNFIWALGAGGNDFDTGLDIAVDNDESSPYAIGSFRNSITFGDTTLVGGSSGNFFLVVLVGSGSFGNAIAITSEGGNVSGVGLALDPVTNGRAYVTGSFSETATFGDTTLVAPPGESSAFIAAISLSGDVQWARQVDGRSQGRDIAVQPGGDSYVTGTFSGMSSFGDTELAAQGDEDLFVTKLDAAGNFVWAIAGGGPGDESGFAIDVDWGGNTYLAGQFQNEAVFGDFMLKVPDDGGGKGKGKGKGGGPTGDFLARLDPLGQFAWVVAEEKASSESQLNGIGIDGSGHTFVAGGTTGSMRFQGTTLSAIGEGSAVVARFNRPSVDATLLAAASFDQDIIFDGPILFSIDPATGFGLPIGPIGFELVVGMETDPTTGILYAISADPGTLEPTIISIDPTTGAGTAVAPSVGKKGSFDGFAGFDLAFRSDGTLFTCPFVVENGKKPDGKACLDLATLDPITGMLSSIGPTETCGLFGLTFDAEGTLVQTLSPFDEGTALLLTLDQTSGLGQFQTDLSFTGFPMSTVESSYSLDTSPGGVLSALVGRFDESGGPRYLATLDPDTGTMTNVGQSVSGLACLAYGPGGTMLATVELQAMVEPGPFTRCVEFAFVDCETDTINTSSHTLSFANGSSGPVSLPIPPLEVGEYDCVRARDPLHSLASSIVPISSMSDLEVSLTGPDALRGGNLNGDTFIDALDWVALVESGFFVSAVVDTDCDTPAPHGDVTGDAFVDLGDASFIAINFAQPDDTACCGLFAQGGEPVMAKYVRDFPRHQRSQAAAADLSGDGIVDVIDVVLAVAGIVPGQGE